MRLFLAIPFSPAERAALLQTAAQMKRKASGTFARPENLPLSLAFLGETERLAASWVALDRACEKAAPFSMAVGGLGMMIPGTATDIAGFVLVVGIVLYQRFSARRAAMV